MEAIMLNDEKIARLEEIAEEIEDLATEALNLLPSDMKQAAASYWHAHILGALDKSRYLGGSMIDLQSQIRKMRNED